ncbi:ABC transporter ATP-binding protein [Propionibacteriaceae bacterium Y1685]
MAAILTTAPSGSRSDGRAATDSPGRDHQRGPRRVTAADRSQLAEHPVSKRRILALFRPHLGTVIMVVALITGSSMIGLAQPFLVREIIDIALPQQNVPLLIMLALGLILVAAITAVIGLIQTWLATGMGERVMHELRTTMFAQLQRQSLAFFTRTRGGDVQSRLTHDIAGMQSVITSTATSVAANVTTVVATAIAMVALSPRLALLSLLVIPPAVLLSRRVALLRREVTGARQRELAGLHTMVEEGLSVSGVRLTKTLGTGMFESDRFAESSERLVGLELRSQLAGRWRMATMSIIFAAIPALIYLAAGFPATSGGMTIGTLVAFTALQATIFRPMMGLLDLGVQWVSAMALFSRIFEYLDLEPDVVPPADPVELDLRTVRGEVRFERVDFTYGSEPILHGVDLVLPAGSTTAIVGPTGSGKSTLGALVPRLHDATAGRVTIDGTDVRDIAADDLARLVGVVSQESYLRHGTVRANLLLADPGATEAQLWQALGTARVADLVAGLPDGLDTVVGARGHRFSGGEQQRLAIARTVLRNPRILVLDEATSALDNTTEAEVQRALDNLSSGRTTLTIAHRLSTVEQADQIVVLSAGRVVERGAPAELRSAGGAYAALAGASRGATLAV